VGTLNPIQRSPVASALTGLAGVSTRPPVGYTAASPYYIYSRRFVSIAGEKVTFHVRGRDTFGGAMRVGGLQLELLLVADAEGSGADGSDEMGAAAECLAVRDLHDGTYRCR
jgi:hypothetical protein